MLSVDPSNREEMEVAKQINQRMVERSISMEGTCTGEHGVGVGKRDYLDYELGQTTVETMRKIKLALDPYSLMNPEKIFRLNTTGTHKRDQQKRGERGQSEENESVIRASEQHMQHQQQIRSMDQSGHHQSAEKVDPSHPLTQYAAAPSAPDTAVRPPQERPSTPALTPITSTSTNKKQK